MTSKLLQASSMLRACNQLTTVWTPHLCYCFVYEKPNCFALTFTTNHIDTRFGCAFNIVFISILYCYKQITASQRTRQRLWSFQGQIVGWLNVDLLWWKAIGNARFQNVNNVYMCSVSVNTRDNAFCIEKKFCLFYFYLILFVYLFLNTRFLLSTKPKMTYSVRIFKSLSI